MKSHKCDEIRAGLGWNLLRRWNEIRLASDAVGFLHEVISPTAGGFIPAEGRISLKKTPLSIDKGVFLVTRTGLEPMLPPWKGGVLTSWPTGLVAAIWLEQMTLRVWTECSTNWAMPPLELSLPKQHDDYTPRMSICQEFFQKFLKKFLTLISPQNR